MTWESLFGVCFVGQNPAKINMEPPQNWRFTLVKIYFPMLSEKKVKNNQFPMDSIWGHHVEVVCFQIRCWIRNLRM